jgi:hypothetical protein
MDANKEFQNLINPYIEKLVNLEKYTESHILEKVDKYYIGRPNPNNSHHSYDITFVVWGESTAFESIGICYISSNSFKEKLGEFYDFIDRIFREISKIENSGSIKIRLDIYDEREHIYEEHTYKITSLF